MAAAKVPRSYFFCLLPLAQMGGRGSLTNFLSVFQPALSDEIGRDVQVNDMCVGGHIIFRVDLLPNSLILGPEHEVGCHDSGISAVKAFLRNLVDGKLAPMCLSLVVHVLERVETTRNNFCYYFRDFKVLPI